MAAAQDTATNYIRFVDCCDGTEIKFNGALNLVNGDVYAYDGLSDFPGSGGSLKTGRCYTAYLEYTAVSPVPYPAAPTIINFSTKQSCTDPKCPQCPEPGCNCPQGYTLIDGDCVNTTYTEASYTGDLVTLQAGNNSIAYGKLGLRLYPDISSFTFPLYGNGFPYTVNQNNGLGPVVTPIIAGLQSTLWGCETPASCSTGTSQGRLNIVGLWNPAYNGPSGGDPSPGPELAFEYCIDIGTTKQYLIGMAGDNQVKLYIDNVLTVNLDATNSGITGPFNYWHVFPITLTAGTHIIKLAGVNFSTSPAAFGAEIYDITLTQFQSTLAIAAVGTPNCGNVVSDLQPFIIFSTEDMIGLSVPDPNDRGEWVCPDGSTVDQCRGVVQCKTEEKFLLECNCYMLIPCDGSDPVLSNNPDFADYVGQIITINSDTYDGCAYVAELTDNDCTELQIATINLEVPCACALDCYYVEGTDGFLYVDENNALQEISAIEGVPYAKVCSKVYPVPQNTSTNFTIVNLGQCDANGCPITCYKLTNCDDPADVIYTNSDSIIPYVFGTNNIVRILNRTGCYIASVLDEGEICDCPISVVVTASFSSCIACTGYTAYKLIACETGDVIYTTDDLEIYVDKTVQTDCGCYLVKKINYLPPSPQSVIIEYVFDNCDKCLATYYLLRNCSTLEVEAYTLTNLSLEVGKVIKVEGCDACLLVEETREPGITTNVVITERFNLCAECIKADQKCKCQSAVNPSNQGSAQLRYIDCNGNQAFTSEVAAGKRSDKYCVLEWATAIDIIDYGDCSTSTTTICHTYLISVPPLPAEGGGVLFYKDCQGNEISQTFPKSKTGVVVVKCGISDQTEDDIYVQGVTSGTLTWLETDNICEQIFDCPAPVYPTRPVIPGYNTPGCDAEKFEKITCKSSEILYKTVMQKRYGISNCCPDEDDKWLIKKELVDLQAAVDPNYTCEPVQSCCTGSSSCNCGCNNQLKTCNS